MSKRKQQDKAAFKKLVKKLERNAERREKVARTRKQWEHPGARNVGDMETYFR